MAPSTSTGYSLVAVARPISTPAATSRLRAKRYMPTASRHAAHRSQLMLPASTIPGATATMAASQGRRPGMRAVTSTATIATAASSMVLMSK